MKKVAFYTLGCKVNQYETNGMIQKFIEHGYQIVEYILFIIPLWFLKVKIYIAISYKPSGLKSND